MVPMVVVKQLARGVALFVALGVVLPPSAEGQEAVAPALGQTLNAAVRRIAPPAARQVPPGSATTSPGERRTMEAIRMTSDDTITLDGRLDEDVWMRAVPATNFLQRDPDNGQPATEQTEVRFVYDDDKLYMGVTLFDSEPDKLIHYQMGRDGNLPADDKLQWAIDTFNDGQSAYWWEMNPLGSMADALRGANNSNNRRWDGIWDARTTRSDIGWTIEMEVPFRTMNFNPDSDGWGVNFQRTIARKNETNLWMGWLRNQGLNRMSNAGELTGIRGVSQGRGLDIKPYLVGTSESFPGRDDVTGTTEAQAGVDLFYNITPSLRTNLTVNTDFAQAQVDARQTNLTRFSLLFPEQRDFFLDGSLFFDFVSSGGGGGGGRGGGAGGQTLIPFQSRRIGLDEENTPQRINFGGKLTGQAGAFDIGVLQVQTGDETEGDAGGSLGEDFTVVRLKRRMFRESCRGRDVYAASHARWSPRRPPHNGCRRAAGDIDISWLRQPERDRLFPAHDQSTRHRRQERGFWCRARLPERSVENADRVPGDPGELRGGGRIYSPDRFPTHQPADRLYSAAEPASMDPPVQFRSTDEPVPRPLRQQPVVDKGDRHHGVSDRHAQAGVDSVSRPPDVRAARAGFQDRA